MRLIVFTLLAIAVAVGIHLGLNELPYAGPGLVKSVTLVLHLVLPMIATAGLAYAMRISNIIYVYFAVIFSPFASFALLVFIAVTFFHDPLL
jgi:hypothetical protein